jgi:hypothetical protein
MDEEARRTLCRFWAELIIAAAGDNKGNANE